MKKLITMTIMVLAVAVAMAQAPEKFTYQAVVRNASNQLVTNAQVGVRVSILQGSANGSAVYVETQTATTNANGLITLQIGGGNVQQGVFVDIDWANGPFFLKTETDPNGGSDYTVTSTQQLLSVPYALYAREAGNSFSGDYNDLTNTPTIPTVPANVSAFTNDAGYITTDSVPTIPTNVSAFSNDAGYLTNYTETDPVFNAWDKDYDDLTNKPTLFSGDYNDLTNQPTIPTVPADISVFNNDAGYITSADIPSQVNADWEATTGVAQILHKPTLFSGNYSDLTNKPTLFSGSYNDLTDKPTLFSGNYNDLTNKPTLFSGSYNDLTNKPVLFSGSYYDLSDRPVLFDGDYNSLSNRPNLATVATTGSYNDLSEKPTIPTIPTNVSAFSNDAGYITSADIPEISTVPTNVSAFTNDAGYITSAQIPAQVNADWNATTGVAQILNKPTLFSGNYNDLTNKPTTVSTFTNDASYVSNAECANVNLCDLATSLAQLNATVADMNSTIDSLRNRIEELENGESPVNPDPVDPDTVPTGTSFNVDGLACPGTAMITDKDGNHYETVAIGQQCWMKTNLKTTKYADGTPVASVGGIYHAGGNVTNDATYGLLYNWSAVMYGSVSSTDNPSGVRGICPTGWHVPSNAEWTQLKQYVSSRIENRCDGNLNNIAKALASTGNWISNSIGCTVGDYAPNNNTTGFTAQPAGDNTGSVGNFASFWSCTQSSSTQAYAFKMESTSATVNQNSTPEKSTGYSVRCVRDSAIVAGSTQMVETGEVSSVTTTTASCGGTVSSGSGLQVAERGVCWSQMPNPTVVDPQPSVVGGHTPNGSGTGAFTASITGLQPGTTYYVRAYATTELGVVYGNTQVFNTVNDASACGLSTVTDRDGYTYNTLKIGTQCWMKENLRTTHYADGTVIAQGSDTSSSIAYYYNSTVKKYNWAAVMHRAPSSSSTVRGICPIGWHVPSSNEWSQLVQCVADSPQYRCANNENYIAKALASNTSAWNSSTNTCAVGNEPSANNATGFGALPAGGYYYGNYNGGEHASFWSSTEGSASRAYTLGLGYNYASVYSSSSNKYYGFSVRCLRD